MNDWEMSYNGLTIGGATYYKIDDVTGLHDTPDVRRTDIDRPRAHGQYPGDDYAGGRSIQATVTIETWHPSTPATVREAFSNAMVIGKRAESPLVVRFPGLAMGRELQVMAKVVNLGMPIDSDYAAGAARAEIRWKCTDPRIYDATATVLSTTMATTAGTGVALPIALPVNLGGPVSGGLVTANNIGEFDAPWSAVITGPVNGPRIENVTTGQALRFNGNLAAGEFLVINSLDFDLLFAGTASWQRELAYGSEWFELVPGPNEIRFAGTSGAGSMQLTFRSTWI